MYYSQCWFDKYLLVKKIPLDAYGPGIEPFIACINDGLFSIGPLGAHRNDT